MYAYSAPRSGQYKDYWESVTYEDHQEVSTKNLTKPRELAYWRKHPNLHGWMQRLWIRKGSPDIENQTFNGIELELTWADLDELEQAVLQSQLPPTEGFFFGMEADDYYRDQDLEFIRQARADLFLGLRVFYNSSW